MFLKQKKFWINLLISVGSIVLIVFLIFQGFGWYTRHGSSVEVPDVVGMPADEAKKTLEKGGFKVEIVDSLYDLPENLKEKGIDFGDVIMQNPKAHEKVKKGRRFYLMIRTSTPPMVEMPNLVDLSLRQALSLLTAKGLNLGKTTSKPGLPPVMRQFYKGQIIKPGTKIPKGSSIDVWVGSGDGEAVEVDIPNLIGLTRNQALSTLGNYGLNPGAEVYTFKAKNAADSAAAVVTRQSPGPNPENKLSQGDDIDLWFTDKK
jgi:beta-lactam-binding protein with PASTA domain